MLLQICCLGNKIRSALSKHPSGVGVGGGGGGGVGDIGAALKIHLVAYILDLHTRNVSPSAGPPVTLGSGVLWTMLCLATA